MSGVRRWVWCEVLWEVCVWCEVYGEGVCLRMLCGDGWIPMTEFFRKRYPLMRQCYTRFVKSIPKFPTTTGNQGIE